MIPNNTGMDSWFSIDDYVCTKGSLLLCVYTKVAALEVWFGKRTGKAKG